MGDDAINPQDTISSYIWQLVDVEQRATEDASQVLPSLDERAGLMPGDSALVLMTSAQNAGLGERLWVRVTRRTKNANGTFYRGRLVDAPQLTSGLKAEDEITFEPKHVLEIEPGDARTPTAPKSGGGGALLLLGLLLLGHKRKKGGKR